MWERFKNWFAPVQLPSENETRIASLLRVMLLAFFVICSILNPIVTLLNISILSIPFTLSLIILGGVYLLLWQFVRWGYINSVSWIVCLIGYMVTTILVLEAGTVLSPFTSIYFISLILTSLLLNTRAIIILTLLNSILLTGVFFWQTNGNFSQQLILQINAFILIAFSMIFGASAVLMILASNSITKTFISLQEQKKELSTKNAELKALRDSLAEKVALRTQEAEQAVYEAQQANTLLAEQIWLAIGQARLSDAVRGKPTPQQLAQNVLQQMCQYLDVQVGNLFVYNQYHRRLDWQAGYAYRPSEETQIQFELGEGVIGQVAKNKEPLLMRDLPSNYLSLITGTAVHETAEALFYPFLYNGNVIAVAELGRWQPFIEKEHLLLERISENVGIAFYTAQTQLTMDLP